MRFKRKCPEYRAVRCPQQGLKRKVLLEEQGQVQTQEPRQGEDFLPRQNRQVAQASSLSMY